MNYHEGCEVCVANKYGLWTRKRTLKTWPKRVRTIFKKLQSGKGLVIFKTGKK